MPEMDYVSEFLNLAKANDVSGLIGFHSSNFDQTLDYTRQQQISKAYRKLIKPALQISNNATSLKPLRLAMLGSTTLTQLIQLLEIHLLHHGFFVDIYEGNFGAFRQEILQPDSTLYEFMPDMALILSDHRDLNLLRNANLTDKQVADEATNWQTLWSTFQQRTSKTIIQNNFDIPGTRLFQNLESRLATGFPQYIYQLNAELRKGLPNSVILHDLEYLTAYHGKRNWYDPRFYFHSKQPCAFEFLPHYAKSLTKLISVTAGKLRKCIVVDLDNTLWGGVIGDDGVEGITIGQGSPEGEAFVAFQKYLKQLEEHGVILAVCSKNDEQVAKRPFEEHPDMILRLEDFAIFVANWEPKSDNIAAIASKLNIGKDSLVFVDDNPAERAIVKEFLPEVLVVDLPPDPAYYVRALAEENAFETTNLAEEDFNRTTMYRENLQREEFEQSLTDMASFLAGLNMTALLREFNATDLDRISQLVLRSNQFNLTTRRHSKDSLVEFMSSEQYVTRSVRLQDRFGDNGLIAVWIGKHADDNTLVIDTWLMSCRVLSRGVEQHLMNHVIEYARQHNVNRILGEYIPTEKNGLVAEHYEKLGFVMDTELESGIQIWSLQLSNIHEPHHTYIEDL